MRIEVVAAELTPQFVVVIVNLVREDNRKIVLIKFVGVLLLPRLFRSTVRAVVSSNPWPVGV